MNKEAYTLGYMGNWQKHGLDATKRSMSAQELAVDYKRRAK